MRAFVIGLVYTVVVFIFGIGFSYLFLFEKPINRTGTTLSNCALDRVSHHENTPPKSKSKQSVAQSVDMAAVYNKKNNNAITLPGNFSHEKAQLMVKALPQFQLNQYLNNLVGSKDLELIDDKRQFAVRAVEEYYSQNDSQPLSGVIKISNSDTMPSDTMDTASVAKNASLFAHLDTNGQIISSGKVFIKWVNVDTKQTLLFEQKDVRSDSTQAWVRLRPKDGWQPGSYEVKYYEFNSQLIPIAQISYRIYDVS